MESILSLPEVNILILQKNIIVMMTVWIMQRPNISEIGIILTMTKIIMKQRMKSPASINGTVLLESMKKKTISEKTVDELLDKEKLYRFGDELFDTVDCFLIFHTVIN